MTGLLGGAFDPPHIGHVALARARASAAPRSSGSSCSSPPTPATRGPRRTPRSRLRLARAAFSGRTRSSSTSTRARRGRRVAAASTTRSSSSAPTSSRPFPPGRSPRRARAGAARRRDAPGLPATARDARPLTADRIVSFEIEPPPVSSSEIRGPRRARRADRRARPAGRRPSDRRARPLPRLTLRAASRRGLDETLTPLEQARRIAGLAQEKLAEDVVILDMRPVCTLHRLLRASARARTRGRRRRSATRCTAA